MPLPILLQNTSKSASNHMMFLPPQLQSNTLCSHPFFKATYHLQFSNSTDSQAFVRCGSIEMLNGIKPGLEDPSICTIFLPKPMRKPTEVSLGSSDRGELHCCNVLVLEGEHDMQCHRKTTTNPPPFLRIRSVLDNVK